MSVGKIEASNLNWTANTATSNTVIVPVGANGYVDIWAGNATHVIADAQGYFTSNPAAPGNSTYTPVLPTRFLDTRYGTGGPAGRVATGGVRTVQIGGTSAGSVSIPPGVTAVAINLGVVAPALPAGYLVPYADGTPMPSPASNLQMSAISGVAIAQLEIVPVGANGRIAIYSSMETDLIGDVVGYFRPGSSGQKYHPMPLTRLVDTRVDGGPVATGATKKVTQSPSVVGRQPTLILNATVTDTAGSGYLVAYPDGPMPSPYSTLNFTAPQTLSNMVLGATNGGVVDFTNASSGGIQLIVDGLGYLSDY